jgi:TetR/AcrR family transcriptional regulator, repressor for uid operon
LARPDRREAQRLATREKLLEISVTEFQRSGFAHTDVATIAERAGVSRGTFYFHFPTKDNVLTELRMREEQRIVQDVAPQLARTASLEEVLRAVVAGVVAAESRLGADLVRDICAVQFRPSVIGSDTLVDHPVAQFVVDVLSRPPGSPGFQTDVPERTDLAVIFLVGMFGLLSTRSGPSQERDRLLDSLVTLTVRGVGTFE